MDLLFSFSFRGKEYRCHAFIDDAEMPAFVFVDLNDEELIDLFGKEVSIKTDFQKVLPKADDIISGIVAFRQSLFDGLILTPEFQAARQKALGNRIG
jgi:hypothetical protein